MSNIFRDMDTLGFYYLLAASLEDIYPPGIWVTM